MPDLQSFHKPRCMLGGMLFLLVCCLPSLLWAQAALENPQEDTVQSGVGIISGWKCTANRVEVVSTVYVGRKGDQVLGYAFIETRTVRTLPATFLVVLSPMGVVQKVLALAFYEPAEYLPTERWLRQFEQKPLGPDLQLRKGIHAIAGATLSAQAVTGAVSGVGAG